MAYDLETVRASVKAKAQDDARFMTDSEITTSITDAVEQVSLDRPLDIYYQFTGDGTQDYVLPTTYIDGFSEIYSVEYPAEENPPVYLDRNDDYFVYYDPSKTAGNKLRLRFKESQPLTTEKVRIIYNSTHSLTESATTLDNRTFLAVVLKSLVYVYRSLAARFTQSSSPTIDANVVDYAGRGQNYIFISERWEAEYKRVISMSEDVRPAQSMQEVDIVWSHGEDMMFHRARLH